MYINIISAGVLYWSGGQVTIETVSVPGNIRKYKLVSKRRRAMKLKSNLKCHKCHLAYLSIFKKKKMRSSRLFSFSVSSNLPVVSKTESKLKFFSAREPFSCHIIALKL